jgi:ribosome-binding protein aMBF1 (putative translation factor)
MMLYHGKSPEQRTSPSESGSRPKPSAFNRSLGARLRELREEHGWSQRALGKQLGILQIEVE